MSFQCNKVTIEQRLVVNNGKIINMSCLVLSVSVASRDSLCGYVGEFVAACEIGTARKLQSVLEDALLEGSSKNQASDFFEES